MHYPERDVRGLLDEGLAPYLADSLRYARFLERLGLSAAEAAAARASWDDAPPHTQYGWPQQGETLPLIVVLLGEEADAVDFLGMDAQAADEAGEQFLDDDGEPGELQVVRQQVRVDLLVMAEHYDVCGYLYRLARNLIEASRTALIELGYDQIGVRGMEVQPDTHTPAGLWTRRISVSMQADYQWTERHGRPVPTAMAVALNDGEPAPAAGDLPAEEAAALGRATATARFTVEEPTI